MVPTKKRTYLSLNNTTKRRENASKPTASWIERYQAIQANWQGIRTVCRPDEIINPESGRCVKRSGKIGKRIMSSAVRFGKQQAKARQSWTALQKTRAVAAQRAASKKIRNSISFRRIPKSFMGSQRPVYLERPGGVRFNIR